MCVCVCVCVWCVYVCERVRAASCVVCMPLPSMLPTVAISELSVTLFRAKIAQHNTTSLGFFHKLGFAEVCTRCTYICTYLAASQVCGCLCVTVCECVHGLLLLSAWIASSVCMDCFFRLQASRSKMFKEITLEFRVSSLEAERMGKASEAAHWMLYA